MKTLIALIATVLLSCGTEDTTSKDKEQAEKDNAAYDGYVPPKPTEQPEEEVTWYVEMPKCTNIKEEKLLYIPEEELILTCRSGKWQVLDLDTTSEMPDTSNCTTVSNENTTSEKE